MRPLGFGGGKENKTKGSKKGRKSKNSKRATPKESGGAAKQQQELPAFISPTFNEIFDTQTPLARPRARTARPPARPRNPPARRRSPRAPFFQC